MVEYLFNSSGDWIAFKIGKYVYDSDGDWIGWLPWGDNDVVDVEGEYLGTIVNSNRIYEFTNHPYRGYPGYAGYSSLPSMAIDITIKKRG